MIPKQIVVFPTFWPVAAIKIPFLVITYPLICFRLGLFAIGMKNSKSEKKNQPFPHEKLLAWFLANRRELPWREEPTPYRVWISEVMLQQTQATVVIPYFERWMETFPTVTHLAQAPLSQVLKLWEGLGYYSRARHLHAAAGLIMQKWGGKMPSSEAELAQIKGIGPYTRAAILSFAFQQKRAAVDGNVARVMARFFAMHAVIDQPHVRREIEKQTQLILPDEKPWLIAEALIELGATLCGKKPGCGVCPLNGNCQAWKTGVQGVLPRRKERTRTIKLYRTVAVVHCGERYLVVQGAKGKVMADLYEFPYLEDQVENRQSLLYRFEEMLKISLQYKRALAPQMHTFTHFKAHLFPHLLETKQINSSYLWIEEENLLQFPFSAGHRRILHELIHARFLISEPQSEFHF